MLSVQEIAVTENESPRFENASTRALVERLMRWMPLTVFAASILVTLMFWKVLPYSFRLNEGSDYAAAYEPVARSILAGRGFTRGDGTPATGYPPGYPLVLAGTFELCRVLGIPDGIGVSAISVFGMGLSSVFVFLLARILWGSLPALVSSALWMTYPFALWLTKQPNSEIPFMVVFYGGLCLFWCALSRRMSARFYFLCGVVFGCAMLIRPIAIGIGLVLSVVVWFARREISVTRRALLIVMLLLGNLLAVLPWEAWAYGRTGNVIVLSTNGVKALCDGLTFAVETKGYRIDSSKVPSDVVQVMNEIRARESEMATFGDVTAVVSREFRSHPLAVTKLFLFKLARSWYATDSQRKELPILFIQLAYLSFACWGCWKAWKRGGIHKTFVICSLLIVVYFWGMTLLALSILRYMVPVVGLLTILIAAGFPRRLKLGVVRGVTE